LRRGTGFAKPARLFGWGVAKMQSEPRAAEIAPAPLYRFEPAWWVHGVAAFALALSVAPLWMMQLWAPGLAFAAPPLVGLAVIWACRRAAQAGQTAFVQARIAQTVTVIPDPIVREAEAEAAWRDSPRTPAAGGWLFWAYAVLGVANAAALWLWVVMALGLFGFAGSGVWAIAAAAAALYGLGFMWTAAGVIAAAVRAGANVANTDDLDRARLIGELQSGRARAEAMAMEAALLAAVGAGMALVVAQALGVTLADIARAAWPAPVDLRTFGVAVPAPNLRELEAPLWRAKMAVSALLGAVAAFLAVLILRTPLAESLARLAGDMAHAQALRDEGQSQAAARRDRAVLGEARELAPLRAVLGVARAFGLTALLVGLGLGLGLMEPGLAAAAAGLIAAAVGLMALERMRQALLGGRLRG
jgi:hypothetical protein